MTPPPPHPDTVDAWRDVAREYLRTEFQEAAPAELGTPTFFPRSPLESEGAVFIFPFAAHRTGPQAEQLFVVVGDTQPNYYPAYALDPDDVFSLHLGTRFMLVMAIAQARLPPTDSYDAMADARGIVDRIAPDAKLENVHVAAAFDCDGAIHAVLRCTLDGDPLYVFGRDAPPGFSRRADLPPHVAYRLHLGHVLRAEADPDRHDSSPPA